jgi:uncharacterized protein YprB with RNaseH-like and TPR domain
MNLRDRIRDVVRQERARPVNEPVLVPVPFDEAVTPSSSAVASERNGASRVASEVERDGVRGSAPIDLVLGGAFLEIDAVSCFVVDRAYPAEARHGAGRIGEYAQVAAQSIGHAGILAPGLPDGADGAGVPLLFFDLETTGLSGGAGTHAFLVGCGYFEGKTFRTRQFFLTGYGAERALLTALSSLLTRIGVLVTFNGKSFDLPVIETRYLFHRLSLPRTTRAHLDMLHPARHFWRRRREPGASRSRSLTDLRWAGDRDEEDRCTLGALERSVLGFRRRGDIPGSEIPSRYFHYVRTGEAAPLEPVFEHNRLDLVSLAALTARGLHLAAEGCAATANAREGLAIGRLYERAGRLDAAVDCYRHAIESWELDALDDRDLVRAEAMRRLALLHRRSRRHADAVVLWERLLRLPGCPAGLVREAAQALAVYHEHRSKDLATAHQYARRCLGDAAAPHAAREAHKRLARVERKLAARASMPETLLSAGTDDA